jgi:hypothetical protein
MRVNRPIVGMASTPSGPRYWLVASDGGGVTFGDAKYPGSTGGRHLASLIVGLTRRGSAGYWLVAGGGVCGFGAPFRGSASGLTCGAPALAMAH